MVNGVNGIALVLLEIINMNYDDIPRFRDCFLKEHGKNLYVVIHTRTGGGNREEYERENEELRKNPNFNFDEDNSFDSTYADFYYNIPSNFKDGLKIIHKEYPSLPPEEKWKILFEKLGVNK